MHRRALLAAALPALATPALAQDLTSRPVTLVVGYAPGGSTDITSRLVADRMGPALGPGGRVVVENRPGASGLIASEWLKRQPTDGSIIMLNEASSHALAPHAVAGGTRYDPIADFTHIGIVGVGPLILVGSPQFPARTAQEAVAFLRSGENPDRLPFASSGVGSMPHLAGEMIAASLGMAGRFPHVAYRSGGQMVESIARGETAWGVAILASAAAQVRDNRVKGFAVTGSDRFPSFPDIPTLNESGLPGFDLANWFAIIGPRGMPDPVVAQLNRALVTSIAEPPLRERLLVAGVAPWTRDNSPAATRAFYQAEFDKFRDIVARTGIRLEP